MEIIIENRDGLREMVAPEGYYITQAADAGDQRIYCRRRIMLPNEITSDWRLATTAEKEATDTEAGRAK